MPNCFTLTRNGEDEPRNLADIDEDLWFLYEGKVPKDRCWYKDWYNNIGLSLALGKTLEECEEIYKDTSLAAVAEFLSVNYKSKAWYERKS